MTTPTYREIVMTFGALKALIGNMIERGGVKVSIHVECDEGDAYRMSTLMRNPDMTPRDLPPPMKMMGMTITWGPKQ